MLTQKLERKLTLWDSKARRRDRVMISRRDDANRINVDGRDYINFASNDYLGLIKHPKIMSAFLDAVNRYGFGSGSSAQVTGYFDIQYECETRFADWLQVDSAILFNSGYLANIGVISALAGRDDTIFSDKLCHASILDGIQLSRAQHYRYRHGDMAHLKALADKQKPDIIITESLFSMEGDIAPMQEIINLSDHYQAQVVIDDAHGMGVLGQQGRGICEHANLTQTQFACLVVPLGKAFNGMGAIVAGREAVIEPILQFARSYRYATALPPAVCAGLLAALTIVKEEVWRKQKLIDIIHYFNTQASERGFKIRSSDITPIRSIMISDNAKVMALQQIMLANGLYIAAIRPPTVPEHSARVRVSLNCLHTQQQVDHLLDVISEYLS